MLATSLTLDDLTAAASSTRAEETYDGVSQRESHDVGGQTLVLTIRKAG